MIHFFDSSALAKRYLVERGSDVVRAAVRRPHVAVARITEVEVAAAIARAHRERALTAEHRDALLARFVTDLAELTIVELRAATTAVARALVTKHPLRGYDAVQLACALSFVRVCRSRSGARTARCAERPRRRGCGR